MANFICEFEGVRGRNLKLYDTKIIITTKKTVGSLITGNFTDGEKTIYLCDVVGVQFKKSGGLIGYLQFETPSLQMNNKSDNMFSENTFTYESGKNGLTNELMEALYNFVTDRIEELKYHHTVLGSTPDFESMKVANQKAGQGKVTGETEKIFCENKDVSTKDAPKNAVIPIQIRKGKYECPVCGCNVKFGEKMCVCFNNLDWSQIVQ